jgi:hypothetical protein
MRVPGLMRLIDWLAMCVLLRIWKWAAGL